MAEVRKSQCNFLIMAQDNLIRINSHDKIKSLKRSGGILSLEDLLSGWAESSCTEDGNAGSPTQSASTGDDAGPTNGVSGCGFGDAAGAL